MLILHAAREVCSEEDFDEVLDGVRDRIDEIESLHRTRELTVSAMSLLCYLPLNAPCHLVQGPRKGRQDQPLCRQRRLSF